MKDYHRFKAVLREETEKVNKDLKDFDDIMGELFGK